MIQAIVDAIKKEGRTLLNWDEDVEQWQHRVLSLRKWYPEQSWSDVTTEALLINNGNWLSPYLSGVKKPADLKKIKLKRNIAL